MIVYQTRNGLIYLLSAIRICVHQSDSLILQLLAVNREEILCYGRCQHLSSAVQCNLVYECKDRRFHSLSVRHNGNYVPVRFLWVERLPALCANQKPSLFLPSSGHCVNNPTLPLYLCIHSHQQKRAHGFPGKFRRPLDFGLAPFWESYLNCRLFRYHSAPMKSFAPDTCTR